MQSYPLNQQTVSIAAASSNSTGSVDASYRQGEGISILFLIIIFCSLAGIAAYKKYKIMAQKKQVQLLERVWRLSISE